MRLSKEIVFMIPKPITEEWMSETYSMLESMGIDTQWWGRDEQNTQVGSFFVSDTWELEELKDLVEQLDDILLFDSIEDYKLALKEWTL